MKKQYILLSISFSLLFFLFFFAKTTHKKNNAATVAEKSTLPTFSIENYIAQEKAKLTPERSIYVTTLENSVKRGDVLAQQIKANMGLASFYKDTLKLFEPYVFYYINAAKLENSEKNLTFAARLILTNLRGEQDEAKLAWKTNQAITLFARAIQAAPNDDELKIDLGSAYIYGKGRNGNAAETMEGIKTLLEVARKDSNNIRAQLMLGVGGVVSGQYDKAIERLKKVAAANPNNVEAIAYLADAYAGKANKQEAIKWYNISKRLINDPHYTEEVEQRIKKLK